jgi:hypothetical protein
MKKSLVSGLLLLLIVVVAAAEKKTDPLWIGMVRIDGLLVPFGTFPAGKWVNSWPILALEEEPNGDKPVRIMDGRISLQDVPDSWKGGKQAVPMKWYVWSEGSQPRILNVSHVEKSSSHCSVGWALKTDLQPAQKVDYAPTPKLGIATSRPLKIISFEPVDKDSKIVLSFLQAVKVRFHEQEKVTQYAMLKNWEKGSIELSRVYRLREEINGSVLYFLEAQRKYPRDNNESDPDCYNLNWMNSWVTLHGDKVTILSSKFFLSDCDGKGNDNVTPKLILALRGKYFIVSENYGYENEFYTIHEILDGSLKEVLNVDGGGC